MICFVFTGALVFFPLNKKCPKWSAFCIYIKNYLFSQIKLTQPVSKNQRNCTKSHAVQIHAERTNAYVNWHGFTDGTAATAPRHAGGSDPWQYGQALTPIGGEWRQSVRTHPAGERRSRADLRFAASPTTKAASFPIALYPARTMHPCASLFWEVFLDTWLF